MRFNICVLLGLVLLVGPGCATMIRGTDEPLSITSEPSGALAEVSDGQKCTTPCQVKLKRNQSVMIKYTKEGYEPESLSVFPTLAGAGVILGGVIDYGTGAVYSLTPNPAHVMLKPAKAQVPAAKIEEPNAKKSFSEQLDELEQMQKEGKITKEEYKVLRERAIKGE
jgi:hypothetical protein